MPNLSGYFPDRAVPPYRWDDMKLGESQSMSSFPSPERVPRSPCSSQLFIREQIPLCHKLYVEDKSWASNPPPPDPRVSDQFCLLQPECPPSHCKAAHHPKTDVAKAVFPSTGQAVPHPLCRTFFPIPLMHSVFMPNR